MIIEISKLNNLIYVNVNSSEENFFKIFKSENENLIEIYRGVDITEGTKHVLKVVLEKENVSLSEEDYNSLIKENVELITCNNREDAYKQLAYDKELSKAIKEVFNENENNFISEFSEYQQDKQLKTINQITLDKQGNSIIKPIINGLFLNVTCFIDPTLKESDDNYIYTLEFYNGFRNKTEIAQLKTKEDLKRIIKNKNLLMIDDNRLLTELLTAYLNVASKENKMKIIETPFKEGYFILNNKVVTNSKLNSVSYPTRTQLRESIRLLNRILSARSKQGKINDCAIYRFMLISPFSFCFKQLGAFESLYSLILNGKTKANKTGSIHIAYRFYNLKATEEDTAISSISSLSSEIDNSTFPTVIDEAYSLFKYEEFKVILRRAITDINLRTVRDNDNIKNLKRRALSLPILLLNETIEFEDYLTSRYNIIYYGTETQLSKEEREEFNRIYKPRAEESILDKLKYIGKVFEKRIIEKIENKEDVLYYDSEQVTIEILKDIEKEANETFISEMKMKTVSSEEYKLNITELIKEILNNDFKKKVKSINYHAYLFIQSANNSDFPFMSYSKRKDSFYIELTKLKKYLNNKKQLKDASITLEENEILEYLNLTDIEIMKFNTINYQKKQRGFHLSVYDLAFKIFNILLESEKDKELEPYENT